LHGLGYELDAADGDYRTARQLFERARDLYLASNNEYEAAKDIVNIATCDERDGLLQKAAAGYRQACGIFEKYGDGIWKERAQNRLAEMEPELSSGNGKEDR